MRQLSETYRKVTKRLDWFLHNISASLIGLTALTMFIQVVSRYALKISLVFIEEISTVLVLYAVFLVAPMMLRKGEHIMVDLFDRVIKGKWKKFQLLIIYIICVVANIFLALSATIGMKFHMDMETLSTTEITYPLWIKFLPFLIGSSLLLIYSVELFICAILDVKKPHQNREEAQ